MEFAFVVLLFALDVSMGDVPETSKTVVQLVSVAPNAIGAASYSLCDGKSNIGCSTSNSEDPG